MQKHNKHLGANEEDALYRPVYITEMAVLKVLDNNLTTCSINSYGPPANVASIICRHITIQSGRNDKSVQLYCLQMVTRTVLTYNVVKFRKRKLL